MKAQIVPDSEHWLLVEPTADRAWCPTCGVRAVGNGRRNVTVRELEEQGGDVAKTLNTHAQEGNADLIIMGGFGHARFREMLLGGVTQSMLSSSPLPVFMSY